VWKDNELEIAVKENNGVGWSSDDVILGRRQDENTVQ
jgi:hypothetical protein